jgi:hypothetical protein
VLGALPALLSAESIPDDGDSLISGAVRALVIPLPR